MECETPTPGPGEAVVRVRAAGICHSDAHYRAGTSPTADLPLTLGHEVAGEVAALADDSDYRVGERVCLHYMATCGACDFCHDGHDQFCVHGEMIGKDRDGGYAEYIVVPERSLVALPDAVSFEEGAVMMCSAATSLHALRKSRLRTGENVAVFGVGGLGMAAVQLAHALGAANVFAVDINPAKLTMAATYGAQTIDANDDDPVAAIRERTAGRGVDVAVELVGLPETIQQSIATLAVGGRAAVAGITNQDVAVAVYRDVICREAELIGVSDHLKTELVELAGMVEAGRLNLAAGIARSLPLEAEAINEALNALDRFGDDVRVVIVP